MWSWSDVKGTLKSAWDYNLPILSGFGGLFGSGFQTPKEATAKAGAIGTASAGAGVGALILRNMNRGTAAPGTEGAMGSRIGTTGESRSTMQQVRDRFTAPGRGYSPGARKSVKQLVTEQATKEALSSTRSYVKSRARRKTTRRRAPARRTSTRRSPAPRTTRSRRASTRAAAPRTRRKRQFSAKQLANQRRFAAMARARRKR